LVVGGVEGDEEDFGVGFGEAAVSQIELLDELALADELREVRDPCQLLFFRQLVELRQIEVCVQKRVPIGQVFQVAVELRLQVLAFHLLGLIRVSVFLLIPLVCLPQILNETIFEL
jgi:hypothetical protein